MKYQVMFVVKIVIVILALLSVLPEKNAAIVTYWSEVSTYFLHDWQTPLIFDWFKYLLRNHMSTIHIIRAHAQEVWDKSDKD